MSSLKLFQIYYDDIQLDHVLPGYTPYKNTHTDIFLETTAIARCFVEHAVDSDWFGAFSWKIKKKFTSDFSFENITQLCGQLHDYDVICPAPTSYNTTSKSSGVTAATRPPRTIQGDVWRTIDLILRKLGKIKQSEQIFKSNPGPMVYTNTFIIKGSVYNDFLYNYIQPAIHLCFTDPAICNNITKKTSYPFRVPNNLTKCTGYTYWPQIPFVFERLINTYIYIEQLKVAWKL